MMFNMNSNKLFFFFIIIFSTMITISSNSWLGCWMGLEINLLSFIPLISNSYNILSNESSLNYFLVQSIASINFLFFILLFSLLFNSFQFKNFIFILINLTILMKMGSFPFYFWFINMIEGMNWMNCFILMTWQKISLIIILSYYMNNNLIMISMIMNSFIGAIGGLNQTSLRKLLAFSSVNNLSWMLSAMLISENLWITYMSIYSFLVMILIMTFYMLNVFFINQIFLFKMNFFLKLFIMMNFLSLGGLPPFLGFMPKWMTINFLMEYKMFLLTFILIMNSLIMLFFYIRVSFSSLLFNYISLKWFKLLIKNKNLKLINFFSMISMFSLIFSTLIYI